MPPKLRASCDACHSAKVKCIKTLTGCQRCDSSGGELACNYSPALPRIYHKKNGHCNRVEDSQASSQPDSLVESSLLDDLYGPKSASQAAPTHSVYAAATATAAAAPASTFDQPLYDYGVNTELNSFFWPCAPLNSMAMPPDPNLWPGNINAVSSTTTTPALTNATTPSDAASTAHFLPTTSRSRGTTMEEANHHPSATSSPERNFAGKTCDCFDNLLQAMQSMKTHMITRNPKLDVVLCANRTAAKLCLRSLQCSPILRSAAHGTASSCVTIACGLLDQILASYEAALHDFCANLDGEVENGGDELENDKDGGVAAENTATVELRLGSFALERSEQVLCASKIVAGEVGRIEEALKGFGNQGQGVQGALLANLSDRCKSVMDQISGS